MSHCHSAPSPLRASHSTVRNRYETVEASAQAAADVEPPKTWGEYDVRMWLAAQAADMHSGRKIDLEADLFEQGFDR